MIPEDVQQILFALLNKSEAREVNWVEVESVGMNPESDDDYVVVLPDSSINIYRDMDDDVVNVKILNSEGDIVLHVVPEQIEEHRLVGRLFNSAKRKALNLDSVLDNLKKALSADGVVGGTKSKSK